MDGREKCFFIELVSIIASSIQLFFALKRLFEDNANFSPRGTLLRDESESQNRSSGNPREILETDVSANESIWRTSRRQGEEAPYYTPHPIPPRALRHRLLHLLFLLSLSGSSAFSAIVVVTAFCHLGRLSSPRSLNAPRAAARSAPARASFPQGWDLSDGSTLIVILSRTLYNDRMLNIILGVYIFR